MLEDAAGIRRVVLACSTVDLRKGIDGLATIIGDKYGQNPFEKGMLFLFCGKRSDRCKDSCGWGPDSCFYINALKQDGYPGQEIYRKHNDLTEEAVQISYDGFKSPGSKNQRCRSEKYLLKRLYKTEKIYFLFCTEKLLSFTMDDRIRTIRSSAIRQERCNCTLKTLYFQRLTYEF